MRFALRTVAVLRSALYTRRDLLLEILALRHQLGVLSRPDRRFRPSDRLFWLCLRRIWPRWREALVLVHAATVARWHRRGFHQWWNSRSRRRPGRPRIDSDVRALIRRLSRENFLWGAPRIHGELLKLGITVSERTVSRYLPDRRIGPSQTWRTFLANHFGDLTGSSTVALSAARGDDDVFDRDDDLFPFGPTPTSGTAGRVQRHGDCRLQSFGPTHISWPVACTGLTFTTGPGQTRSGRDPPRSWPSPLANARLLRPVMPFPPGTPVAHAIRSPGVLDRDRQFAGLRA